MEEIAKKIRETRLKQGLSVAKLSALSGVSTRAIVYIEGGHRAIVTNIISLCDALGLKLTIQ